MRLLLAVSVVLLAGCSGYGTPSTSPSSSKSVSLYDNYFENGNLTLAAGTTVTYENEGKNAHTVTVHWVGDPLTTYKLDRTLQPGQSVSFTFSTPGTYHVWCRFHGAMTSGMATVVHV